MTQLDPASASTPSRDSGRSAATSALVLAIVALAVPALLFLFFPLLAVAAAVAVAAVVLAIVARRRGRRGPMTGWSLGLAAVAFVVNVVLFVVMFWAATWTWRLNRIEIITQGGPHYTAEYHVDISSGEETWSDDWERTWTSEGRQAEITLTALPDDPLSLLPDTGPSPLSCRILINGEVVVEEKSDTGSVTCRYDG